jgi:hypothetical protein
MTNTAKKTFEELTPEDCKDLKIEFAPGCFDDFDGTQEELDAFIAEITEMIHNGDVLDSAKAVDFDTMMEEDPEVAEKLIRALSNNPVPRNIQ